MTPREESPWPHTWRELWELTNRPRPVDARAVRVACWALLVGSCVVAVTRYDPRFLWLRAIECAYALAGVILGPRFGWRGVRAYTRGLALLLPLAAAYVGGVSGNRLPDLAVTALATFVPLPFLVTARDILALTASLALAHGALLALLPPPAAPLATVYGVLGGALVSGAVAAFTMVVTRAGLRESTAWWQQACERERLLREFTEVTASALKHPDLLDRLAERFVAAFGGGRCCIVLATETGRFGVAGTAGFHPATVELMKRDAFSPLLEGLIRQAIDQREAVVREGLTAAQRAQMRERWGQPLTARCLVTLPLTVEDVVAGVVVLSASEPRRIAESDLRLWEAMAKQLGVAVADASLLARLERALRAKSEFLNTMSHELRSPLHVIVGYADMLHEGGEPAHPGEVGERIRGSALELLRLVEETMTAAQLEAGRLVLRADEFSAEELVADLAESVRALPEAQNGTAVHWEAAADLPRLRLDRLKVKEIVTNLVSNALKFTPRGEVRVRLGREADALSVAVEDTGLGIPPEAHARIFEMFERVEAADAVRPPGVGLGLYIVNRLVRLMGGTIEVESAPRRGSRFTVRLPLQLDGAAA
jgi:signal transduction histidine kinase